VYAHSFWLDMGMDMTMGHRGSATRLSYSGKASARASTSSVMRRGEKLSSGAVLDNGAIHVGNGKGEVCVEGRVSQRSSAGYS